MFNRPKCSDGAHKFEARYDEKPGNVEIRSVRGVSAADLRELMLLRVYVHDICVKCGKVVTR